MEPNSGSEIVRESCAEVAWKILRVADFSAGVGVIHSPAGVSVGISKGEKDLAQFIIMGAIKPGFIHMGLGPGPALCGQAGPLDRHSGGWIKIQNALAGLADHDLPAAHVVIGFL